MTDLTPRLRAVCDLMIPEVREYSGLHEYDGHIQDLSPDGVAAAVARLGDGEPLEDAYDEAHLQTFEDALRYEYGELQMHRRNPLLHVSNLDLSSYDKEYAPAEEREAAKRRHLAAWPQAIDAAIASLDLVSRPVAEATLGAVRGLSAGLDAQAGADEAAALAAHARLVDHVERATRDGSPDAAIGTEALGRLVNVWDALDIDVAELARRADAERDRLKVMLTEACKRLDPSKEPAELIEELLRDHPDADGVLNEARQQTEEVIAFTKARDLLEYVDGVCNVGPAPESRRWAMAMMSWAAPGEPDGPSWYHVTPPDTSWPEEQQEEWLAVFSRTTLPAITAHEVSPGHYAHGRALRNAPTEVRRILQSSAFAEGWAHYAEELFIEEGFRGDDPRYPIGVAIEALVRVTRLACSIGLHTGTMTVDDASRRFEQDAFLKGPAARSEAMRGTFDVTYGRYTLGKLMILDLRERARERWGTAYTHKRFNSAMLDLGSPPLGLLDTALERG